jgi:type IV pilus assembly protein PilN
MKLNINLASQPYEDARQFYLQWLPLLIGLLALTILLSAKAYSTFEHRRATARELAAENDRIEKLQAERKQAETTMAQPANSGTRDQAKFLNQVFKRKSFSWTQVLSDLEQLMPRGVQVVSMTPELAPGGQLRFRMDVESQRRDAVIELVRRMEESPHFKDAQIRAEASDRESNVIGAEIESRYLVLAGSGAR